jgi:lysophospholipase L1-like esterase
MYSLHGLSIIIIVICTLFFIRRLLSSYETEGFEERTAVVLLGDSILRNDRYVSNGKSVGDLLGEKMQFTYNYAQDNAVINELPHQIEQIPTKFNNSNTYLILSIGGNDILQNYRNREDEDFILHTVFSAYKKRVKTLRTKFHNANIIIFDLYYPASTKYEPYYNIIRNWNSHIEQFIRENNNSQMRLLKISRLLTDPTDFTFGIEPSSMGSVKLVENIMMLIE